MKVRTLKRALLAAGVLALGQAAMAGEVDYTGYFRVEAAHNSEDGKQSCFKLAGAQAKYRLGNECDNYGELVLNNVVGKSDDGAVFSTHVMFSVLNNSASDQNLSPGNTAAANTTGQFGLPQIYIMAEKVPELAGGNAWIGRRYYKREDIHIMDFFYWNPSGMGAGIEDLPFGDGLKFSYALIRDDNQVETFTSGDTGVGCAATGLNGTPLGCGSSSTRHDLQVRGLKVNDGGTLEFGLTLVSADSKAPDTKSGVGVTVQHRQAGLFGGENKLAFQYMTDSAVANGATGNLQPVVGTQNENLKRVRVVEGLYFQPTPTLGGQVIGVYQNDSSDVATDINAVRWTSLGGRLAIGLTPHFKLNMDLGFDTAQPKGMSTGNLMKLSIAPTLAIGPAYYGRPELRLFYTYAKWNDAARTNANALAGTTSCTAPSAAGYDPISMCGVYGKSSNGSVIGFQAETWW